MRQCVNLGKFSNRDVKFLDHLKLAHKTFKFMKKYDKVQQAEKKLSVCCTLKLKIWHYNILIFP